MNPQALRWKQRYERLKCFLDDAMMEIEKEDFEKCDKRAWDPPKILYCSFAGDVCDTEAQAIKAFGKDNFDVYELKKASKKDMP